ncbi:MAG: hypothetical protein BJ554DRAFT_7821, partial [Olpidium bornovanus]
GKGEALRLADFEGGSGEALFDWRASRGAILLVDPRVRGPSALDPAAAASALRPPLARRPPSPAARLPWPRSTGGLRVVLQHSYSRTSKAYKLWDPSSDQIVERFDVTVDERRPYVAADFEAA